MSSLQVLEGGETLVLGPLLAALSRALDLTEGQPMGHSVSACLIALKIADQIGLSATERHDLQLAMLLKDTGCSSNATRMFEIFGGNDLDAKRDAKFCNWCSFTEGIIYVLKHTAPHLLLTERLKKLTNITCTPGRLMDRITQIRCERGADIVRLLGLGEHVAEAVYSLDEHWNGFGSPHGLKKDAIPLLSRIACLAQTVAVFQSHFGKEKALQVARSRRKTWFDPALVRALFAFEDDVRFWDDLRQRPREALDSLTSDSLLTEVSASDLDTICLAFAAIVDAKSPFTADHSRRVAQYAVEIGARLGFSQDGLAELRRAGLLHDLGKLGVPNLILEKPGKLTGEEWETVRRHPEWTAKVLSGLPALARVKEIAAAHHEKLNGTGYWRGLSSDRLDLPQRVLAVADIWDALTANRPYRDGMTPEQALAILDKDAGLALDADCIETLRSDPPKLKLAA